MLVRDKMRPIGVLLEVVEDPQARRDKLDAFGLTVSDGMPSVAFTRSTLTLRIGGRDCSAQEWIDYRGKVDSLLLHEGVVKKVPEPNRGRSSDFLSVNVERIVGMKRGRLKPAPWWLRWLFDAVVSKEELHDTG